ncbi:MAG: hypothetical protein AAGI30_10540 [Planctomycetota bacterium]
MTMATRQAILVASMFTLAAASAVRADIAVIDERFNEWGADDLVAIDPIGDAPGGAFDLGRVWAKTAGTTLFLSFEMLGQTVNLQSGHLSDGGPQLWIGVQDGDDLSVFFRPRFVTLGDIDDPSALFGAPRLAWDAVDFALLPTVAASRYEMRIDLSPAGVNPGDTVLLDFATPTLAGSPGSVPTDFESPDALSSPVAITLAPLPAPSPSGDESELVARPQGTTLRVASLNTLRSGLTNTFPPAVASFDRLLRVAAADVYCFQEQAGTPQQLIDRLAAADPRGDGASWNVHTDPQGGLFSSDYIATPLPLTPVEDPPLTNAYAAGVVGTDPETAVLVLSVHPKCCGFVGSFEDQLRIAEAEDIRDMLARFRTGVISPSLVPFKDVPVIVIGDWNLVGSNGPREILTDQASGTGLRHQVLLNLDGRDATSWRDLSPSPGGFAPGLLDLAVHSSRSLDVTGGFVLDSHRLTPSQRTAIGVDASDSLVSDHLLLVADYRPMIAALDIDADGVLAIGDITDYLGDLVDGLPGAEWNDDLVVDAFDGAEFVDLFAHWAIE